MGHLADHGSISLSRLRGYVRLPNNEFELRLFDGGLRPPPPQTLNKVACRPLKCAAFYWSLLGNGDSSSFKETVNEKITNFDLERDEDIEDF